jgi:hypothetical protein
MTANSDCDPVIATVLFKIRVRIVGYCEASGDKFRLRRFSIRYLSGRKPWAYFRSMCTTETTSSSCVPRTRTVDGS